MTRNNTGTRHPNDEEARRLTFLSYICRVSDRDHIALYHLRMGKAKIELTGILVLALLMILWEVIDQVRPWSSGPLGTPAVIGILTVIASVVVGALTAHAKALLALAPPLLFLICLELAGYTSDHQDGAPPLSFRSLFLLAVFAIFILLGILLGIKGVSRPGPQDEQSAAAERGR